MGIIVIGIAVLAILALLAIICLWAFGRRTVVPTNEVHIVQQAKATVSYGKDKDAGNVYYKWPEWFPRIGMTRRILPTTMFSVRLNDYEAYDKDRTPFRIEVEAFFQIADSDVAAQSVENFEELTSQLESIVKGAARSMLATYDINEIMTERSTFGKAFTEDVQQQLPAWGVKSVKSIELMDIKDAPGQEVIANIMAKKISQIESESRTEVARNLRTASLVEIEAQQEVEMRRQESEETIGKRTAEKEKTVGIARERTQQEVSQEAAVTKTREMEVRKVEEVRGADIRREVSVVKAEEDRQTSVINAEAQQKTALIAATAQKESQVIRAEGNKRQIELEADAALTQAQREAEGIQARGEAEAAAETARLRAPVTTQIELAKEIGENQGYQTYLLSVESINATKEVGIAQAKALEGASVKVIANTGTPTEGINKVSGLFGAAGGLNMGAMVESFANTPAGAAVLNRLGVKTEDDTTPPSSKSPDIVPDEY